MSRRDDLRPLTRGLTPVEVFDYDDGPRFYSCRDVVGQLYLVFWADQSEAGTSWLYVVSALNGIPRSNGAMWR